MVGDYYKNAWTYLDFLISLSVLLLVIIWILQNTKANNVYVHKIFRICLTVVIFLIWLRLLRACRSFQTAGQFITIMGKVFLIWMIWLRDIPCFKGHCTHSRSVRDFLRTQGFLQIFDGFPWKQVRRILGMKCPQPYLAKAYSLFDKVTFFIWMQNLSYLAKFNPVFG